MGYIVAFQLLCGLFASFVAARKRRSRLAWFAVGMLLPIVGVVLALKVRHSSVRRKAPVGGVSPGRRAPNRCSGCYIPDCLGCPHFSRPLFDPSYGDSRRGHCKLFGRDLFDDAQKADSRLIMEE